MVCTQRRILTMRLVVAIAALSLVLSSPARSQTIETPVPFDSARRMLAITSDVADRLGLRPPAWPVSGAYREARLFSVAPSGGFTLVVERPTGAFERFTISDAARASLSGVVDAAILASGGLSARGVPAVVVSDPIGNRFAGRLTVLSAIAYGPLAASLADEGPGAAALYLATTGLTFFASYGAAQQNQFTRAQADLASDLGLASGAGGYLLGYAGSGRGEDKGVRALALGSAFAGTITGAVVGKGMTDAEAHGTTLGIEVGAATGLAISRALTDNGRVAAATVVATGAIGLPLGLMYARRAPYTVTAGDAESVGLSGLIGAAWSATTLGDSPTDRRVAATLGTGYVLGALIGDLTIARDLNLTRSQSNVLKVGALAGGLVGAVIPVLAEDVQPAVAFAAVAGGATLAVATLAGSFPQTSLALGPVGRMRWSFSPSGLFGLKSRRPGLYPLGRVTF
jgi:hypothetical protein